MTAASHPILARDLFLLTQIVPRHESPAFNALAYDFMVEKLGQPGTGYDPFKVFEAASALHRTHGRAYLELEKQGMDALRDAGWFPEAAGDRGNLAGIALRGAALTPELSDAIASYARVHADNLKRTAFPPRQSQSGERDE